MPTATSFSWQLVAIGIKFRRLAITTSDRAVHYWSWRQRRVESLSAFRATPPPHGGSTRNPPTAQGVAKRFPEQKTDSRNGVPTT